MLRQALKILKPSILRLKYRSLTDFSKKAQRLYLEKNLPPDIYQVLMESTCTYSSFSKVLEVTLYDKLQSASYRNYIEKAVLLDEETSVRIAESVVTHTRGDRSTTFFDGEGGLCQIAAAVSKCDVFDNICVLEKDICMSNLHDYAKSNYLDAKITVHDDVNLAQNAAEGFGDKLTFVPPILKYLPKGKVTEEIPSYTIVSTASAGMVKYLTDRMLYRDNPLGEFYSSRPEFFLVMTARTYFHICCGYSSLEPEYRRVSEEVMRQKRKEEVVYQGTQTTKHNILFQVLFDFCLVDVLPRESYFPWKKYKTFRIAGQGQRVGTGSGTKRADKVYEQHHSTLMLVYVRPKKIEELDIGKPHYFEHFVLRIVKNKSRRIVELMEEFATGWGFAALEAGFTVLSEVKDLDGVEDFLKIYNLITALPDFEQSNFAAEAIENYRTNIEICSLDTKEMEEFRIQFRRDRSMDGIFEDEEMII